MSRFDVYATLFVDDEEFKGKTLPSREALVRFTGTSRFHRVTYGNNSASHRYMHMHSQSREFTPPFPIVFADCDGDVMYGRRLAPPVDARPEIITGFKQVAHGFPGDDRGKGYGITFVPTTRPINLATSTWHHQERGH